MKRVSIFTVAAALSLLFAANANAEWPNCASPRRCPPGHTWSCDRCVQILEWKKGRRAFRNEWGNTCWRPRRCTVCCETPFGGSYCEFDEERCGP